MANIKMSYINYDFTIIRERRIQFQVMSQGVYNKNNNNSDSNNNNNDNDNNNNDNDNNNNDNDNKMIIIKINNDNNNNNPPQFQRGFDRSFNLFLNCS